MGTTACGSVWRAVSSRCAPGLAQRLDDGAHVQRRLDVIQHDQRVLAAEQQPRHLGQSGGIARLRLPPRRIEARERAAQYLARVGQLLAQHDGDAIRETSLGAQLMQRDRRQGGLADAAHPAERRHADGPVAQPSQQPVEIGLAPDKRLRYRQQRLVEGRTKARRWRGLRLRLRLSLPGQLLLERDGQAAVERLGDLARVEDAPFLLHVNRRPDACAQQDEKRQERCAVDHVGKNRATSWNRHEQSRQQIRGIGQPVRILRSRWRAAHSPRVRRTRG